MSKSITKTSWCAIVATGLLVLGLLTAWFTPAQAAIGNTEFGIAFPPVSDQQARSFSGNALTDLGVSNIRIDENWSFREPQPGVYNWAGLDERMSWAAQNDLNVLLTVRSDGPDWACQLPRSGNSCVFNDLPAFADYIEALMQRYPGQISKIQFGNEWQDDFGYSGTDQEFIDAHNTLYSAVKGVSPNTPVVLGGFSTLALRYVAYCTYRVDQVLTDEGTIYDYSDRAGICSSPKYQKLYNRSVTVLDQANYDLADVHLYDDVENWSDYYDMVDEVVTTPIIVTEFGGPHPELGTTNPGMLVYELNNYMFELVDMNVPEAYYFSLVERGDDAVHGNSGLIDGDTLQTTSRYTLFKMNLNMLDN